MTVSAAPSTTATDRYRTPGFSLPGELYTSNETFAADLQAVFYCSWLFVATEADIPEAGDYVSIDIGDQSIIIIRDDDDEIHALHNVCRHRGSRLLDSCRGSVGNLVCPYHQWTYAPSGELLHAESLPADFYKTSHGLLPVHVRVVAGLVFVSLANEPPADFEDFAATVAPYIAPHDLSHAKVAARIDLVEDGNWKLVMENNRECVHCGGHPELSRSLFPTYGYAPEDVSRRLRPAYERYQQTHDEFIATCRSVGLQWEAVEDLTSRPTGFRIEREPLDQAGESFTLDGRAASKRLLGDLPSPRLGRLSMHLQPNAWFHFLGDHAVTFSVLPVDAAHTLLRTTWLVNREAVEGVDYEIDHLTAVWKATNEQDSVFVARAHRGVSDPAYRPGPYLAPEYQVDAFCEWYTNRLAEHENSDA